MKTASLWLALVAGTACHTAQALDTMRCGSRLASTEMTAAEVIAACGEPQFRDVWATSAAHGGGALGYSEEWTYNFGSSQLLRVLRFRQGRLQRIDTEGYGFAPGSGGNCSSESITPGMGKYRLIEACGEPLTRVADVVQVPYQRKRSWHDTPRDDATGHGLWEMVYREEWVYNFGTARFMRVVIIENGRVIDVDTAGRGFDR